MALRNLTDASEVWFVPSKKLVGTAINAGARQFYFPSSDGEFATLYGNMGDDFTIITRARRSEGDFAVLTRPMQDPGVIPVWSFGQHSLSTLDDMIDTRWGDDRSGDDFEMAGMNYTPHPGQEHRIIIEGVPRGERQDFVLHEIMPRQRDNDDVILHMADPMPLKVILNAQLWAFTHTAWIGRGLPMLPNGLEPRDNFEDYDLWFELLGSDWQRALASEESLYGYNVRALLWAAENWHRSESFPGGGMSAQTVVLAPRHKAKDSWICDTCTVQKTCKFFRSGAVCSIPGSYPGELSQQFQTRSSDTVLTGMQALLSANVHRIHRLMRDEIDSGKIDPALTRLMNQTFDRAAVMAKLIDPVLAASGATRINITLGGEKARERGGISYDERNQQAMVAQAVQDLQALGYSMEEIDADMIRRYLSPEGVERKQLGT